MPAVTLDDFERIARDVMAPGAWGYVVGGAGDETTLRDNRAAFERWRLRPRVFLRYGLSVPRAGARSTAPTPTLRNTRRRSLRVSRSRRRPPAHQSSRSKSIQMRLYSSVQEAGSWKEWGSTG